MVCLNPKFETGHNFLFSEKYGGPWYFVKKQAKQTFDFNISLERPLSKLSENHKINFIGPTELKLWPFNDACLQLFTASSSIYIGETSSDSGAVREGISRGVCDSTICVRDSTVCVHSHPPCVCVCVGPGEHQG